MKLPNYTAEASLGPSRNTYSAVGCTDDRIRGAIAPATNCSGVNCDAAQFFCFASLDLDPISCGLYYGCCQGQVSQAPTADDCRNNPCGPGCPSDLCIQSLQAALSSSDALSSGISDISSKLSSIEKQLRGIARCVCPPPTITALDPSVVYRVLQPPIPPRPFATP